MVSKDDGRGKKPKIGPERVSRRVDKMLSLTPYKYSKTRV